MLEPEEESRIISEAMRALGKRSKGKPKKIDPELAAERARKAAKARWKKNNDKY